MTVSTKTPSKKTTEPAPEIPEGPKSVEYGGVLYMVPAALDLPVELLEADGELDVIRLILGDDQYKVFRETKPTLRNLKELGEMLADAAGFGEAGN